MTDGGQRLPERQKYEYQRLADLTLYFLDYRLKMFGIFLALNGVWDGKASSAPRRKSRGPP
jgi:hypothetical protein